MHEAPGVDGGGQDDAGFDGRMGGAGTHDIGFDAFSLFLAAVEMEGDDHGICGGVDDFESFFERDKEVVIAGHDDLVAILLQQLTGLSGYAQGEPGFKVCRSLVLAAVTGVENDGLQGFAGYVVVWPESRVNKSDQIEPGEMGIVVLDPYRLGEMVEDTVKSSLLVINPEFSFDPGIFQDDRVRGFGYFFELVKLAHVFHWEIRIPVDGLIGPLKTIGSYGGWQIIAEQG